MGTFFAAIRQALWIVLVPTKLPRSVVSSRPDSWVPYSPACCLIACRTTSPTGMVRVEEGVFGDPKIGLPVRAARDELPVDPDGAEVEGDPVERQAEDLAAAHPGAGRERDEELIARCDRLAERKDGLGADGNQ